MAACGLSAGPCGPDKRGAHAESCDDAGEDSATRPMLGWPRPRSHSSDETAADGEPTTATWFTTKLPGSSHHDKAAPQMNPIATWFSTSGRGAQPQRPSGASGGPTCAAMMLVCTVAGLLTTLVVMLCWVLYRMVWPEGSLQPVLPAPPSVPQVQWLDFKPGCGVAEEGIEYAMGQNFSKRGRLDHIPSWEMCCAMCHGIPDCRAWVWKKNKALKEDGDPHSCYTLPDAPRGKSQKKVSKGAVSGLPPRRPALLMREYPGQEIQVVADDLDTGEEDVAATLYCIALVVAEGYERDFMEFQHSLRTGIFGCNAFGVYSNATVGVAPGVRTRNIKINLECELGGEFGTALNSWIFIALWRKVIKDGVFRKHDWTIKADADSVFFPQRLRPILQEHGSADYINNCKYGLHGPIEVLHRRALEALERDFIESEDGQVPRRCTDELLSVLDQYGEDYWLDKCLSEILALNSEMDGRLLCEANCDCEDWYWCKNETEHVSYHPFKREDMYRQCMANAINKLEAEAWR